MHICVYIYTQIVDSNIYLNIYPSIYPNLINQLSMLCALSAAGTLLHAIGAWDMLTPQQPAAALPPRFRGRISKQQYD